MSSPLTKELLAKAKPVAKDFTDFLTEAVTPFHCVQAVSRMLQSAGFTQLREHEAWTLTRGGQYYVTRNAGSLIAFTVGGKFSSENGAKIVGAHTDSPNLMLKPKSKLTKSGYCGVDVQMYGGGLWHSWFDRDLSVAGKVVFRSKSNPTVLFTKLVDVKRPILRIPNLAIHLTKAEDRDKFSPNKETNMVPILSTVIAAALHGDQSPDEAKHCAGLTRVVLEAAGESSDSVDIVDFDLSVYDAAVPTVGGLYEEFVFSGRLDNLNSCYCVTKALIACSSSVPEDPMVRMAVYFDHEEVGSSSPSGAEGSLVPDVVERLTTSFVNEKIGSQTRPIFVSNSFCISADCAHAVHPNYADRHNGQHAPMLHGGPVVKFNCNMRYATNAETAATLRVLADLAKSPLQDFCVKNDSPCGSTIGPILSTLTGIATVDIGNPMWSMHSVRETCGSVDLVHMIELLKAFYSSYHGVKVTNQ